MVPRGGEQLVPRNRKAAGEDFGVVIKERVSSSPGAHIVSWEDLKNPFYSHFETKFTLKAENSGTSVRVGQVSCAINPTPATEKDQQDQATKNLKNLLDRVAAYIASRPGHDATGGP